ncbi:MAG: DUF1080 domain-containing protein, partial [Verrucomicrobiales bacterium]|nr:DUF1080 domain-containing protein [Verrucomicrobiales bacterium]
MKSLLPLIALIATAHGNVLLPGSDVQGLYDATLTANDFVLEGEGRCVALGNQTYRLLLRAEVDGEMKDSEVPGTTDGETGTVTFAGPVGEYAVNLTYAKDKISGTFGDSATLTLNKTKRPSPTIGKPAPEGAIVLIDGKNFDNMKPNKGEWFPADEADNSIQVPKGGMNSIAKFAGSFDAHVEFMCPLEPKKRSQGRGNSGFYLPSGKEIQVLDSFGTGTYMGGGCGGLYKLKNPDTMAPIPSMAGAKDNTSNLSSRPPLHWQTYDVEYR